MKKRLFALLMAALMLLAMTACGESNPDGKKLLEDAASNAQPITYSSVDMELAMEEPESGIAIDYTLKVEGDTQVAYTDLTMSVMGITIGGDFYVNTATSPVYTYFEGTDGKWYKASAEDASTGSVASMNTAFNAESLAMITAMCSEVKTIGKENFNGTDAYKVQLVLDLSKAMELSNSYISLDDMGMSEEDLAASKEALGELSNVIELYAYIEAATPRYLGMSVTFNKDAIKKLAAQNTTDAEALASITAMLETLEFSLVSTASYNNKTVEMPDAAAAAIELTDPEEIAEKMPMLSALEGLLNMAQ